jgi:hypothetical protein
MRSGSRSGEGGRLAWVLGMTTLERTLAKAVTKIVIKLDHRDVP